jgi:hypothetical protein
MKGDFSRYTFDKKKHYNGVLMQQGRVQLDADWNEQQAIDRYRTEIQGTDVIGPCGAPWDNPGFKITFKKDKQLSIGKGRYYTDGILCENEQPIVYMEQPDFHEPPDVLKLLKKMQAKMGLVYLDVWQRHITALDEPYIREKALGGPDTTTRLKTVWQVKVLPLPSVVINNPNVLTEKIVKRQNLEVKLNSLLLQPGVNSEKIEEARQKLADVQHEILGLIPHPLCGKDFEEWKKKTAPSTGTLNARTVPPPTDERPCLLPPLAGYQRLENQLYRVEVHIGGTRNEAYFKWSRDNASVVTEIIEINGKDVTVSDVGKDKILGFANDQWVEISDDEIELSGQSGQLVRIVNVNSATNVIELEDQPISVDMELHPKLRRWDQVDQAGLPAKKDGVEMKAGWLPLEEGIEVKFSNANDNYKTGDYWLIPGRTATGEIEWPPYEVPNTNPIPQRPLGIKHHFCRLALFFVSERKFHLLEDCRRLFPPVTELTSLFYVSGDGQEAMPGEELSQPLLVGVANGQWPVAGATVRFKIRQGEGQLQGIGPNGHVKTGPDGTARCRWKLDDETRSQQVEVTLLGSSDKSIHIPIIFTANLSTADQVAYDPKDCAKLTGKNTVQEAIDGLCRIGGGGCAVSVGEKGGQYKDLRQALEKLLKEETDICICLLPGEHDLPDGLEITTPSGRSNVYLKITGCGPGTRIHLKKPWQVSSLGSFVLRDVAITFDNVQDITMQCAQCREVTLESCSLTGVTKERMLLSIEGADRIRLEENIINAYRRISLNRPDNVLNDAGLEAKGLFKVLSQREFNLGASKFAKEVSALPLRRRKPIATKIRKFVDGPGAKLSLAEKNSYTGLANILVARRVNIMESSLLANIKKIRAVAQRTAPGNAVVIMDENADVIFESNDINGVVSFYGVHGKETLKDEELKSLEVYIKEGQVKISGSTGRLQARNNRFTRLLVADNLIKKIKEIIEQPEGELDGVFGQCFLTDNLIETGQNQFITQHLSMMSNLFEVGDIGEGEAVVVAATAIADSAVYVGNQANNEVRLRNVSRVKQEAANLAMTLI